MPASFSSSSFALVRLSNSLLWASLFACLALSRCRSSGDFDSPKTLLHILFNHLTGAESAPWSFIAAVRDASSFSSSSSSASSTGAVVFTVPASPIALSAPSIHFVYSEITAPSSRGTSDACCSPVWAPFVSPSPAAAEAASGLRSLGSSSSGTWSLVTVASASFGRLCSSCRSRSAASRELSAAEAAASSAGASAWSLFNSSRNLFRSASAFLMRSLRRSTPYRRSASRAFLSLRSSEPSCAQLFGHLVVERHSSLPSQQSQTPSFTLEE
mmetsp:Transcript_55586/g.119997  ORF Transcript_55586/g.119997 Transcript_55586/m.119997 type:complete len:271 (-) Transcript_55586:332-1144(-)